MIAVIDDAQVRELFRHLRDYRGLTRDQLARLVHVDRRTVNGRETGAQGYTVRALTDTARVFGYRLALLPEHGDLALIPKRHPGARPTGTGWPT